jgi:hypothetical protein
VVNVSHIIPIKIQGHEQYDSPGVSDDRLDIFASGSDIEGPSAKVISGKTDYEKKRLKDNSSEVCN